MSEATVANVQEVRGHIIARPRLTRLLDTTSAHVILLVAPAGYGKTTLAREWLRASAMWYAASSASSDIAALVRGLTAAVCPDGDPRADRLIRVVAGTPDLEKAVPALVSELQQMFSAFYPRWLVIDDYHLVGSSAAQELIDGLSRARSINLLVI